MKPGREQLLNWVAETIQSLSPCGRLLVAIEGIDAAGKTTFADALAPVLQDIGRHPVRAGIDGFHNPRHVRYRRGRLSPEGYYRDSFNLSTLKETLLTPFKQGRVFRTQTYDYREDRPYLSPLFDADPDAVLLFDGVFLCHPELASLWDLRVLLDVGYEECLRRAVSRDPGEEDEIRRQYNARYFPGQRLYINEAQPRVYADIVIDNNDPSNPRLNRVRPGLRKPEEQ